VAKLPDGSSSLKIVDFGISKHIGGSARNQAATTSAQVLGSPYYMPPEQMRAEPVDERSDIWSLGAILFEMLTARPPFLGDTLPEVYAAVLSQPVPSVDGLRRGIPAGLDDIVQRCLDKDPAQRFCDVADLAEALAPFGGPMSAQSVERITRILTNPELFHARASNLSKGAPAPELPSAAGTARGGIGMYREPALAGMPLVEVGSASALSPALVTPAVSRAHRAGTSSPELGPLSATGSLADLEPPGGSRGARSAWAALAVLTLLVGGGLWLVRGREPLSHLAAAPPPLVAAPYRDSVPASQDESAAAAPAPRAPAVGAGKVPELQTRSQALKPGAVRPAPISVERFRAVVANRNAPAGDKPDKEKKPKGKTAKAPAAPSKLADGPRSEPRAGSESPAPAAPGPAPRREAAGAREEDPWNPSSFGDRH